MEATADLLKEGQKATIAGLKDGDFSQKLAEMGCVPGTEIVRPPNWPHPKNQQFTGHYR